MSEALFLKEGFIKANAPLKNGLGRYIPQLMRITIKFCKESPTSAGVRYEWMHAAILVCYISV